MNKEIEKFKKENPDSKIKVLYDGQTAIADQERIADSREYALYKLKLINDFGVWRRFKIVRKKYDEKAGEMRFVEMHIPEEVAFKMLEALEKEREIVKGV